MNTIFNITLKELRSYFYSPLAYVILGMFSLISGYFFTAIVFATRNANAFSDFIGSMSGLFILIIPVITMKTFAEENRAGTFELILSYPVTSWHLVAGKFLGAFLFSFIMIIPSFLYVSFLQMYSVPDYGLIISCYSGIVMLLMAFSSIGIFSSVLTKSQVIASISGFGILLLLWAVDFLKSYAPYSISKIIGYISVKHNLMYFTSGIFDSRSIIFFLSLTFIGIFFTVRIIEHKRYRS